MSIPPVLRSLAAIGAIAAFCSTTGKCLAGEQNPLVVVGVSPEKVAISYPTPTYPAGCVRMRIQGNVVHRSQFAVRCENVLPSELRWARMINGEQRTVNRKNKAPIQDFSRLVPLAR
jgi:hypothetical protein